jgi:hypothetical protein
MMEQLISNETVEKATGKSWEEWVKFLDQAGARNMTHKEIARWLYDQKLVTDSWCQGVTVGYERAIGRREIGQNCYGEYTTAATKALPGTLDSMLERWLARVKGMTVFNNVGLLDEPRVSATEKWRYWRTSLADGSKLSINICEQKNGRILLGINHVNLADKPTADAWKLYWKELLSTL